jgi:hypothetical protein
MSNSNQKTPGKTTPAKTTPGKTTPAKTTPANTTTPALDRYLAAIDEQMRRLDVIRRLQEAQRDAIENEDGEALEAIMAARDRVIDEMRAAEADCDSARTAWTSGAGTSAQGTDPAQAAQAHAAASALRELADAIVARDAADEQQLLTRSERLREELGQLGRKRDALGAYRPRAGSDAPAYQDRSA